MLKEVAIKYYRMGYNCAESIIRAGNEVYDLGLHDKDMNMTAAFGGGFQIGDVCGALSGAACVISSRYVETKAHDYAPIDAKAGHRFSETHGFSPMCANQTGIS